MSSQARDAYEAFLTENTQVTVPVTVIPHATERIEAFTKNPDGSALVVFETRGHSTTAHIRILQIKRAGLTWCVARESKMNKVCEYQSRNGQASDADGYDKARDARRNEVACINTLALPFAESDAVHKYIRTGELSDTPWTSGWPF